MTSQLTPYRLRPSSRGAMVMLGLIVFGAIILGGLYLAPKGHAPIVPPNVPAGVPGRSLRFVCYDMARQHPQNDPLFAAIAGLRPDYVLLQDVEEDDAIQIAELLQMQRSFHPQLYQRSEHLAGRKGTWGNLILSRQDLYDGAPIGGIRGGFGATALSVVDGKQFRVACIHLAGGEMGGAETADLRKLAASQIGLPFVVTVLASDPAPPGGLSFLTRAAGSEGEWMYTSGDWVVGAMGSASASGKGAAPMWVDLAAAMGRK